MGRFWMKGSWGSNEAEGTGQFMTQIVDVTKEYSEESKPGSGRVIFEDGYEQKWHKEEIAIAEWLNSIFGGDVILLKENTVYGMKTPDYLWRGVPWEHKGLSTQNINTIDGRIRKAYAQIEGNGGGIVLDFTDSVLTLEQAVESALKSLSKRARGGI